MLGFNSLLCELLLNFFVLDPISEELQWSPFDLFVEYLPTCTLCVPDFDADHRIKSSISLQQTLGFRYNGLQDGPLESCLSSTTNYGVRVYSSTFEVVPDEFVQSVR